MKTIRMTLVTILLLSLQTNSYCSSFSDVNFQSIRKVSSDSTSDERTQAISTDSQSSFEIPGAPRKAPVKRKSLNVTHTSTASSISMKKNIHDVTNNLNNVRL